MIQRLGGTGQRGLEVTEDGVDPLELGQISRIGRAHDIRHVDTARLGDCRKATRPSLVTVAVDRRAFRDWVDSDDDATGSRGEPTEADF